MRTGLIGKKLGMTRVFADDGRHVPVTVISLENCQVVGQRKVDKDGYLALILGAGERRPKRVNKALKGQFAKAKTPLKRKLAEFRVSEDAMVEVGAEIMASHFVPGQFVDVTGTSIGKGFAGSIKRHNFKGGRASHGASVSHRAHGSTGQRQDPGKVFKGKKMAGHLGDERVTTLNLEVVETRPGEGLILVRGAVPGANGSWVFIRDAVKKPLPKEVPLPAGLKGAATKAPAPAEQLEAKPEAPQPEAKAEAPAEQASEAKPAEEQKPETEAKPAGEEKAGKKVEEKPEAKTEAKAGKKPETEAKAPEAKEEKKPEAAPAKTEQEKPAKAKEEKKD